MTQKRSGILLDLAVVAVVILVLLVVIGFARRPTSRDGATAKPSVEITSELGAAHIIVDNRVVAVVWRSADRQGFIFSRGPLPYEGFEVTAASGAAPGWMRVTGEQTQILGEQTGHKLIHSVARIRMEGTELTCHVTASTAEGATGIIVFCEQ